MKRSSGIIVTGLSAVLLTAGAASGAGIFSGDGATATATAQASALDTSGTTADPSTSASASPEASASASASATPEASATAESTPEATADASATPEATTDSSASSSGSSSDATADTSTAVSGTFDGSAVPTRYGTFQAEITVDNGAITAISWLQDGATDGHSQRINEYAIPQLEKAILSAQDVNVGYVSGASYTSGGVEDAVLSAMQAAGLA